MKWWSMGVLLASLILLAGCGSALVQTNGASGTRSTPLPAIVARVNGVGIHRDAIVQAEALLKNQHGPKPVKKTAQQLEAQAVQLVIQQVVLAQIAKQKGLDPTVAQAKVAYQQLVKSDPSFLKVVKSTGSTAAGPSPLWISAYQASTGTGRLIRQAVGHQGIQAEDMFIHRLVSRAHVVLSPGVP